MERATEVGTNHVITGLVPVIPIGKALNLTVSRWQEQARP
jgi:hypothetical protein